VRARRNRGGTGGRGAEQRELRTRETGGGAASELTTDHLGFEHNVLRMGHVVMVLARTALLSPPLLGRDAERAAKGVRKMRLIGETRRQRDFAERHVRVDHELHRPLDA
jgi:hypothetical protein